MKKLFICGLATLSMVGLTACGEKNNLEKRIDAKRNIETAFAASKNVLLDASTTKEGIEGVNKDGNVYSVSVNTLIALEELEPSYSCDVTFTYDLENFTFSAPSEFTAYGYDFSWNSVGGFTVK